MYPSRKFHRWRGKSTPSADGYAALERNLWHLAFVGVAARSLSGIPQVLVRRLKAQWFRDHSFDRNSLLKQSASRFCAAGMYTALGSVRYSWAHSKIGRTSSSNVLLLVPNVHHLAHPILRLSSPSRMIQRLGRLEELL